MVVYYLFPSYLHITVFLYSLEVSVSFSQPVYNINENDQSVLIKLFLNNTVTTDITVQVRANDNTATGEYTKYVHNTLLVMILQEEVLIIILDHTM